MSGMYPDSAAAPAERQAHDLAAIHDLFSSILGEITGETLPAPPESLTSGAWISQVRRVVAVLDLAISPLMLRDALKNPAQRPTAVALLRYFVQKCCLRQPDRDKTDFVVTFLYRTWNPDPDANGSDPVMFEKEIASVLGAPVPPLSEEHQHLLREFELFRSEVYGFRHFDEITDSGIVHRVRSMKECFGAAFYHPRVLAAAAAYNVFFRERFDDLFRKAAAEIRQFAASVLRESADTVGPRPRRAAVKDLSEAEEAKILDQEYRHAQEELREISYLRKVAGQQRSKPPRTAAGGLQDGQEEDKIRKMQEMVCVYLQAAGARPCFTVPLPFGSFRLTNAELAAFRAGYATEKSFRAEFAAVVMRAAALRARMTAELLEYSAQRGAAYRWKPHADSLTYLLRSAERLLQQSSTLLPRIEERGLSNKRQILEESLEVLRLHMQEVARALNQVV